MEDDGIVRAIDFPNAEERLADAKENVAAVVKVSKGEKYPVLVDGRNVKSITREARAYYAGGEIANAISAMAVLIGAPVSRMIGNFYLSFSNPKLPAKLFTSETQALEWLKGFIK